MKFCIISDIHNNLSAFETSLSNNDCDIVVCLGDIIEYCDPSSECIQKVKDTCNIVIKGNHEQWELNDKHSRLVGKDREYIESLPSEYMIDGILLVHANPADPRKHSLFINSRHRAQQAFDSFEEDVCIVGHSHSPRVFRLSPEGKLSLESLSELTDATMELLEGWRYIIDAGSIGQPSFEVTACYVVCDTRKKTVAC